MGYIVTINSESKQALALLEIVKSFDFAEVKKIKKTALAKPTRVYTEKEEKFKKMLTQGLKEMKAIRSGKMKAGKLEDLLNEL